MNYETSAGHDEAARLGITVEQYRSGKEALKENDKDAGVKSRYMEAQEEMMALLREVVPTYEAHAQVIEVAAAGTLSGMVAARVEEAHRRATRVRKLLTKIEGRTP